MFTSATQFSLLSASSVALHECFDWKTKTNRQKNRTTEWTYKHINHISASRGSAEHTNQGENLMALGLLCFPWAAAAVKDAQILWPKYSYRQNYLTYIPSKCYIRWNTSEPIINVLTPHCFKETFDIFPFHHIALNQMKDYVAILHATDIWGVDGICLESCIQS